MRTVSEPSFLAGIEERSARLFAVLRGLATKHGAVEVRGKGLLVAMDLGRPIGREVVDAARAKGLLLNAPRPHLLRFMPALNVELASIDAMGSILDEVLGELGS